MGEGNFQDYGMRMYNPRIGRFFTVDPLTKSYPELTPYQFASNTPIQAIDLDGEEKFHYTLIRSDKGKPTLKLSRVENFTETSTEWKPTLTNWFNSETTTVVNPRKEYIVHGIVTVTAGLDGDRISSQDVTWTFSSKAEMQAAETHGGPNKYGGWSSSSSDQWFNVAAYRGAIGLLEAEAESETGGMAGLGSKLRFGNKVLTKFERIKIMFSKLEKANSPKNQEEAIALINKTLNKVEDAYSGVVKASDAKFNPNRDDGRMYGILDDTFVKTLEDGTKIATTKGNRIILKKDGGFDIQTKDGSKTLFTKDGKGKKN
jgi:hypothetical protein